MSGQREIIRVENVCYRYPSEQVRALEGVSLSIAQGEFVAVLGHNGSGKSTLAKLLNALFVPESGKVYVDGLDTSAEDSEWDVRRACGMVFQNPDNQLVATIVEEDVAFGLENLGVPQPEIRRRVDEALRAVKMQDYAGHAPHMLSGGQKQRVAIAGVLAMRPRAIVFDEATAMLDPSGRAEVLEVAHRLNREEGITVIWITHYMEEAAVAGRVVVMSEGKIALEGAPAEVFARAEELRALGLDVPAMAALGDRLRAKGIPVAKNVLTVSEMVVELCRLKR